jgi:multiple sugar transport system substrate-binding protein
MRWTRLVVLLAATVLVGAACAGEGAGGDGGGGGDGAGGAGGGGGGGAAVCDGAIDGAPATVEAWFHSGTGAERETLESQVAAFNQGQENVQVELTLLPEGDYNEQVQAAAASGDLPAILDFDGPFLYNYAWAGNLLPLDSCISQDLRSDLLPSIVNQGTYADQLWGVGTFDSGLGLYARRSVLEDAGIRIPGGPEDAWTAEEFTAVLKELKDAGFDKPLDLKVNYGQGEWFTYGFSPIVQSAGGDLINRGDYQSADGVLNGDASIAALDVFQGWFEEGLVDFNEDDAAFIDGRSAISWVGHWQFAPYKDAFGDDLAILPLPDFGEGTRTGMGSWQWGITSAAADPDAAWAFIEFLLGPDQVVAMTTANGAVPATQSAVDLSPQFAAGGAEAIYIAQLQGAPTLAVPRPQTPAYPTITSAFAQAIQAIIDGADVKAALDDAVAAIDQDIADNEGYPTSG